jgi:hypothetical protein
MWRNFLVTGGKLKCTFNLHALQRILNISGFRGSKLCLMLHSLYIQPTQTAFYASAKQICGLYGPYGNWFQLGKFRKLRWASSVVQRTAENSRSCMTFAGISVCWKYSSFGVHSETRLNVQVVNYVNSISCRCFVRNYSAKDNIR